MKRRIGLAIGILVLSAVGALNAQTRTIVGRITDHITAKPISYGTVTVEEHRISDNVRPDGVFIVRVPIRDVNELEERDSAMKPMP